MALLALWIPPPALAQAASPSDFAVAPGDMIRVSVWQEEDLSGEFMVDLEGRVVFPMLGLQDVSSRRWSDVRADLLGQYARELRNPSVELVPLRRIFVLGEVTAPGAYSIDPTMSLVGAVAMAGGAGPQGDLRKTRVVRGGEVVVDGFDTEQLLDRVGIRSGDQVFVGRKGWVERNSPFLVTAALSLTSIIVTLAAR